MKIKSLGYLTHQLIFGNIDVITDPLSLNDVGLKLGKNNADVLLYTNEVKKITEVEKKTVEEKITISKKQKIFHIDTPGEYELGGLMVRRNIDQNYYILDEEFIRVIYIGNISKEVKADDFKNLGDVEVLIIPVGDGENFPEFDVIEKIISTVDPLLLIPSGFKTENMKIEFDLKTAEDFVKQAGYTNVQNEKVVSITGAPEKEVRKMEVVILE